MLFENWRQIETRRGAMCLSFCAVRGNKLIRLQVISIFLHWFLDTRCSCLLCSTINCHLCVSSNLSSVAPTAISGNCLLLSLQQVCQRHHYRYRFAFDYSYSFQDTIVMEYLSITIQGRYHDMSGLPSETNQRKQCFAMVRNLVS